MSDLGGVPLPDDANASSESIAALVDAVRTATGTPCAACGTALCGHDAVSSIVLGYRHRPHCHRCLAAELHQDVGALVERVCQYLRRRDCHRAGWSWANQHEGFADGDPVVPPCVPGSANDALDPSTVPVPEPTSSEPADLATAATWDAGGMGCGDLVLELRRRLVSMLPGEVLRVTALDPGAPLDIPAWCSLTGHRLRASVHPDYWIQRRSG